jgi:hypothetical protein
VGFVSFAATSAATFLSDMMAIARRCSNYMLKAFWAAAALEGQRYGREIL